MHVFRLEDASTTMTSFSLRAHAKRIAIEHHIFIAAGDNYRVKRKLNEKGECDQQLLFLCAVRCYEGRARLITEKKTRKMARKWAKSERILYDVHCTMYMCAPAPLDPYDVQAERK